MAGVDDLPPYTGAERGRGRGTRPCFSGRDRVGPEYQPYRASRSHSNAVPVGRNPLSKELLATEEYIRREYGGGVFCEYSSSTEQIVCDGVGSGGRKRRPPYDLHSDNLWDIRAEKKLSGTKKSPPAYRTYRRSMEEDGRRCMPGGGSGEPGSDAPSCDKTGTSPGQMEEEERLARLCELKARLGSPAESVGSQASSGQFDDAEMEHGSRSRTVSSCSDSTAMSCPRSPLQDLVIPLPDSSEEMIAKYISMENLRDSPIPLPDPSGCFSPRSDISEEDIFARNQRETTPQAGTAAYTPITESSLPSQSAVATEAHSFKSDAYSRMEEAQSQQDAKKSKPMLGPLKSESTKGYTPGSYLANRDKYLGLSSESKTTSSLSQTKMSSSSNSSDVKASSESSRKERLNRENVSERSYSSSATARIQKELDEQYRALMGDDDARSSPSLHESKGNDEKPERPPPSYDQSMRQSLQRENMPRESSQRESLQRESSQRERSLREGSLRESSQRESTSRDSEPHDLYSRESLVKEVLAREAREARDRERNIGKPAASSRYMTEPDPSLTTSDRESMSSGYSSGSSGYTLKDYKSYVASKYGQDQAAKIRESTPRAYTVRYDSPSSPQEETPYFVRDESVSSDKSYGSDRNYDSDMRGYEGYGYRGGSYNPDGRFSVGRDRYGDLYSDRDYEGRRRSHSVTSDKSYGSSAYRSSGYQSEAGDSDYFYGGVPPAQEYRRGYNYTTPDAPPSREKPYRRASSGDSMRGNWSSYEKPARKRQSVLDAISVLDGPIRALVEDLLDPSDWDKNSLWDRHSSLLQDDNFCRDFFTKDWAMKDDDFFGDFTKRRSTTVKQTKTEIHPGKAGEPQRFQQTTTEKRILDDFTSANPHPNKRPSSTPAQQSSPEERQYDYPPTSISSSSSSSSASSSARPPARDYDRTPSQENMFDKTRFEFGSFGAYDGDRRGNGTEASNRAETSMTEASSTSRNLQEHKVCDENEQRQAVASHLTQPEIALRKGGDESNTLFFRDFDDLIHRFKDLKWKDALEAYMAEEQKEKKPEKKEDGQSRTPDRHAPQASTPHHHHSNHLHGDGRLGLSSWSTVTMGSEQEEVGRSKGRAPTPVHDFRRGTPPESGPPSPSFLQAEEDEFERLFTELLYASHSRAAAAAKMADIGLYDAPSLEREFSKKPQQPQAWGSGGVRRPTQEDECQGEVVQDSDSHTPPGTGTPPLTPPAHGTEGTPPPHDHCHHQERIKPPPVLGNQARSLEGKQHRAGGSTCLQSDSPDSRGKVCSNGLIHSLSSPAQLDEAEEEGFYKNPSVEPGEIGAEELGQYQEDSLTMEESESHPHHLHRHRQGDGNETPKQQQPPPLRKAKSFQGGDGPGPHTELPFARGPGLGRRSDGALHQGSNRDGRLFDTGDKLFFDLLDDLDNLTGDTPSMKRRQRARDIFSDWLFNEQAKSGSSSSIEDSAPRNRKSFHEYLTHNNDGEEKTPGVGGSSPDLSDRQSRAGSEPSQRKRPHSGVNITGEDHLHSPPVSQHHDPAKGQGKCKLSMSEQDAILERKLREQYLASRGCKSAENLNYLKNEDCPSPRNSPKHLSPTSTPPKKSFPKVSKQIPQLTSATKTSPPMSPKFIRASGQGGPRCSANPVDTLEILKNVKFRKKSPKCLLSMKSGGEVVGDDHTNGSSGVDKLVPRLSALGVNNGGGALHPHPNGNHPHPHHRHQPRNIYQRWKLRGRPLSFEYLSEKIYSDNTVVYSKRRSLQEHSPPGGETEPEDLFSPPEEVGRPPVVPEEAWSTLRQIPPTREAETSLIEEKRDQYGSIRYDTVKLFILEDDADSGYHTGESTLRGGGGAGAPAPPPPSERTLSREDLRRRIEAFNDNQHGLLMTLRQTTDTFQGFIRVYMNLMRPISMSLTARPPSIYDILTPDPTDVTEHDSDTQLTSFYLPKDTTKVIHITSCTTAQEVIRALLQKFRITDNPRKFALYERLTEDNGKSSMRRLRDDECPLALCLSWTAEGLNFHRFILQENDTGEIMWEAFSYPELDNFLKILNREEEEYVEQVKAKYQLMKIQIKQHLKHLEQEKFPKDQRTPVFV